MGEGPEAASLLFWRHKVYTSRKTHANVHTVTHTRQDALKAHNAYTLYHTINPTSYAGYTGFVVSIQHSYTQGYTQHTHSYIPRVIHRVLYKTDNMCITISSSTKGKPLVILGCIL